jgi:hypothetical protein
MLGRLRKAHTHTHTHTERLTHIAFSVGLFLLVPGSLEKIFCRARDSRFIAIVNGPGAVTQDQIKSSMACSFMGSALVFLILFSVLFFLKPGGFAMVFLMTAAVLLAIPNFRSTWRLYKTVQVFNHTQLKRSQESIKLTGSDLRAVHRDKSIASLRASERDNLPFDYPSESECVYLVTERYRISSPTEKFAWIMFGVEVACFFLWPFVSLFMVGNYPLALLFGLVAGITGMRYYINAAIVLEETGNMDLVDGPTEREKWRNQARLNGTRARCLQRNALRRKMCSVLSKYKLTLPYKILSRSLPFLPALSIQKLLEMSLEVKVMRFGCPCWVFSVWSFSHCLLDRLVRVKPSKRPLIFRTS